MPAAIKLMRLGKKGQPYYRIVVIDKRKKRKSNYLEKIGSYNPIDNPAKIILDQNKLDAWLKKGAMVSAGVQKILHYAKKIKKAEI